uniref:G protein-coupled receptor n=1 Tax=Caenorhabditis tropicalis TaxID=1561998 RepID=A0A1I7T8X0_9PELO
MVYPKNPYLYSEGVTHAVAKVGFLSSLVFGTTVILLNTFVTRNVNIHSYNDGFFYFTGQKPFDLGKEALTIFLVDKTALEYFRTEIGVHYDIHIDKCAALALLAHDPVDYSIRWWNLSFTICVSIVMSVQYIIIIYCGWSMHLRMESKIVHFSHVLKRLHRQFFKTLILQITAPTLFLFIPIAFVLYLPLLNLQISIPTGPVICAFGLYPATDALIVLSVVTEYRVRARKLSRRLMTKMLSCMTGGEQNVPSATTTRPTHLVDKI